MLQIANAPAIAEISWTESWGFILSIIAILVSVSLALWQVWVHFLSGPRVQVAVTFIVQVKARGDASESRYGFGELTMTSKTRDWKTTLVDVEKVKKEQFNGDASTLDLLRVTVINRGRMGCDVLSVGFSTGEKEGYRAYRHADDLALPHFLEAGTQRSWDVATVDDAQGFAKHNRCTSLRGAAQLWNGKTVYSRTLRVLEKK